MIGRWLDRSVVGPVGGWTDRTSQYDPVFKLIENVDMIQLWIRMTKTTCLMRDGFMSLVLLTCHTSDAILGIFLFQMRFTDLHGGYMFDERWFHVTCSSNLLCT